MTIISNEVDSASTWERPRKIVSAGTKRTPPPTPTRPPARPPATAIRTAITSFICSIRSAEPAKNQIAMRVPLCSFEDQLDRDSDQQQGEEVGDGALGDALLDRGPEPPPKHCRNREQQAGDDVDVAVDASLREGAEQADEDD